MQLMRIQKMAWIPLPNARKHCWHITQSIRFQKVKNSYEVVRRKRKLRKRNHSFFTWPFHVHISQRFLNLVNFSVYPGVIVYNRLKILPQQQCEKPHRATYLYIETKYHLLVLQNNRLSASWFMQQHGQRYADLPEKLSINQEKML